MKAVWQDAVLAESEQTVVVEGKHYFPPQSIHKEYFDDSETHSTCAWKGTANYYHIHVGIENNPDAAWYYPEPKDGAKSIKGYIAFWRGVKVID
jgi:uncharacterized protein (DUF427 family)